MTSPTLPRITLPIYSRINVIGIPCSGSSGRCTGLRKILSTGKKAEGLTIRTPDVYPSIGFRHRPVLPVHGLVLIIPMLEIEDRKQAYRDF